MYTYYVSHTENDNYLYTTIYMICVTDGVHIKGVINSPHHGQRLHRTGSVDTLSPCESIASDDLMLDYDGSDASSYEEQQRLALNDIIFNSSDAEVNVVIKSFFCRIKLS